MKVKFCKVNKNFAPVSSREIQHQSQNTSKISKIEIGFGRSFGEGEQSRFQASVTRSHAIIRLMTAESSNVSSFLPAKIRKVDQYRNVNSLLYMSLER